MSPNSRTRVPPKERRLTLEQALQKWGDYAAPGQDQAPSWPGRDREEDWPKRKRRGIDGSDTEPFPPWEVVQLWRDDMSGDKLHHDRLRELQLALRRGHAVAWGIELRVKARKRSYRLIRRKAWADPSLSSETGVSPIGLILYGRNDSAFAQGDYQRFVDLFFVDPAPPARELGRPRRDPRIQELFLERRARNVPYVGPKAEANDIEAEIRRERNAPKHGPLRKAAFSTIEKAVSALAAEYESAIPRDKV